MSESPSGQPSDPSPASPNSRASEDLPFAITQEPVTPEGPHDDIAAPAPAYEHLGDLPATYGTQTVYLVAYDPRRLFAYWDIDWLSTPNARYTLNVCRVEGEVEAQIEISAAETGRYVEIRCPGGGYYVELGVRARDGSWQPAATSARVVMPPEGLSGETEPQFATLPFHLSFQRLLGLIHNAMGTGEDLTAAVSRLQQGDQPQVAAFLGHLGQLSGPQLHTLETLLGKHLEVEGGSSPGGASEQNFLRDRHDAAPATALGSDGRLALGAGGSENLSSGAFGSENLSSGAFGSDHGSLAAVLGKEKLSSGAFGSESLIYGALTSGSDTLSSDFLGMQALNSELLSSGAFGSESLSSQPLGLGGGSDLFDHERGTIFLRAMEKNLDVLGSLFSAFGSPGASDGFSAGGW